MKDKNEHNQIGIIIISHGDLSASILRTAENILGPLNDCVSISIDMAHDTDEAVRRINAAAQRLDKGHGVLILTDMFGGTPTNLALSLLAHHKVEVVTGINLPMALKAFSCRENDLDKLASLVDNAGKDGILIAGNILREKDK